MVILIKTEVYFVIVTYLLFHYFYKSGRQTYLTYSSNKRREYRKVMKLEYGLKKPVVELVIIKLQDLIHSNGCVQSFMLTDVYLNNLVQLTSSNANNF